MSSHQTRLGTVIPHTHSRHMSLSEDTGEFSGASHRFIAGDVYERQRSYQGHQFDALHEGHIASHLPYHRHSLPANQSFMQHAHSVDRYSSFDVTRSGRHLGSTDVVYTGDAHYYQQPSRREGAAYSGGSRFQYDTSSSTNVDYSKSSRQSASELTLHKDQPAARSLPDQQSFGFTSHHRFHGDEVRYERDVQSIRSEHPQSDVVRMRQQQEMYGHRHIHYPPIEGPQSLSYSGGQEYVKSPSSAPHSIESLSKSKSFHGDEGMDADRMLADDNVFKVTRVHCIVFSYCLSFIVLFVLEYVC